MSAPFVLSDTVNLAAAVVIGMFFGFFLERGGMGNPHKLTGVFYRTDFAVPKMMFSAILVAATGLCLLSDLKVLDMSRVWIIPTFFWPQLVGGALFGLGYLVSGYCPGTAAAGFASGRLDALVTMVGIGSGTLLFSALYPWLEGFYKTTDMGTVTLPELLKVNHWALLALVYVFAGIMFYAMERHERRRHASMVKEALHAAS
ncbi:MAG TPA: DUF6691 family protein [Nitrospirota bacterium]|nr:DUF6691 family protein [Nitrospirota bacterium]